MESAAREGDPNATSLAGWLWYPLRLPGLIGQIPLIGGLAGAVLAARWLRWPRGDGAWLWGVFLSGWLLTTLSPNKDPRYLAPLLPLLALLLARGWLLLWALVPKGLRSPFFGLSLLTTAFFSWQARAKAILPAPAFPQPQFQIVEAVQADSPDQLRTLIVVPSRPQLNQHSISFLGRRGGGGLVGRQLGSSPADIQPALEQAQQVLLATDDQGSVLSLIHS